MDVVCSVFVLIGVILIIVSMVHRHKGMWSLKDDEYSRGFRTPFEETLAGAILIFVAVLYEIGSIFGIKTGVCVFIAACAICAVFAYVMLGRCDEDAHNDYLALFILSLVGIPFGTVMLMAVW